MKQYEELIEQIKSQNTRLIYISGKSCTGKTTLSNYITSALDFSVIELDAEIAKLPETHGIDRYIEVYRKTDDTDLIKLFVDNVHKSINDQLAEHNGVIFEGAIATTETLHKVVNQHDREFPFVYLLPANFDAYRSRIQTRLESPSPGLAPDFWAEFSGETLDQYKIDRIITPEITEAISRYTKKSMEEAKTRLDMFRESFKDIFVIEV